MTDQNTPTRPQVETTPAERAEHVFDVTISQYFDQIIMHMPGVKTEMIKHIETEIRAAIRDLQTESAPPSNAQHAAILDYQRLLAEKDAEIAQLRNKTIVQAEQIDQLRKDKAELIELEKTSGRRSQNRLDSEINMLADIVNELQGVREQDQRHNELRALGATHEQIRHYESRIHNETIGRVKDRIRLSDLEIGPVKPRPR